MYTQCYSCTFIDLCVSGFCVRVCAAITMGGRHGKIFSECVPCMLNAATHTRNRTSLSYVQSAFRVNSTGMYAAVMIDCCLCSNISSQIVSKVNNLQRPLCSAQLIPGIQVILRQFSHPCQDLKFGNPSNCSLYTSHDFEISSQITVGGCSV